MLIRIRTTTNFFDNRKEDAAALPQIAPVSIGSASRPVHWSRAIKHIRRLTERPADPFDRNKQQPVVDGSESFLGVLLPRPFVNVTRSSFSDFSTRDAKATQDFQRPVNPESQRSQSKASRRPSDPFNYRLAPDFGPIELVSVAILFSESEQDQSKESSGPIDLSHHPDDTGASVISATEANSTVTGSSFILAPPSPLRAPRKSKSNFFPQLSSRLSFRSVSDATPLAQQSRLFPLLASPLVSPASPLSPSNNADDLTFELAPPQPFFLRESHSSSLSLGSSRKAPSESVPQPQKDKFQLS